MKKVHDLTSSYREIAKKTSHVPRLHCAIFKELCRRQTERRRSEASGNSIRRFLRRGCLPTRAPRRENLVPNVSRTCSPPALSGTHYRRALRIREVSEIRANLSRMKLGKGSSHDITRLFFTSFATSRFWNIRFLSLIDLFWGRRAIRWCRITRLKSHKPCFALEIKLSKRTRAISSTRREHRQLDARHKFSRKRSACVKPLHLSFCSNAAARDI